MSKLYNRAFNVGVLFNVSLFAVLNLFSYFVAQKRYIQYGDMLTGISGVGGFPSWGFPFVWEKGNHFDVIWLGDEVLNFVIIAFFGFVFGFLFRFVWAKLSSRRSPLK